MNTVTLFRIAIFASAFVSTVLAVYLYNRREGSQSLRFLSGFSIANMVYATSYLFEIAAPTLVEVKFFLSMEYTGIFFIPVFWVLIAWSYHPDKPSYNQRILRQLRVLYAIPFIVIPIVWTNDWHHLIYYDMWIDRNLPISLLKVDRAPGFWIINGIIVILYLVGTFRMVFNLIRSQGNHRKQYLLLTMAAIPPFLSYVLVLKQSVNPGLDLNPIGFALSVLLLFWGMANLQLFNILPIAQNMVIDAMQDAMIILDTKGRLIESNLPAKQLFESEDSRPTRVPIAKLNPHLALQFTHPLDIHEVELVIPKTGELRTFSIYQSPITDRRNRTRGNLYLLHDLTEIRAYVKELEHLASSDGLTDLLNHRHFMNLAAKEADKLQAMGSGKFSLVMFDLDHFKAINDSYGHNAGDDVLQQIGHMVSQHARANDLCARYGGEEFVILLENADMDLALKFTESLRAAIENTVFTSHGTGLYLTASFGVSTYTPESGNSWGITLNQADTALYAAKAAGRNIVKPFLPNEQTNNEVAGPLPR